MSAGKRVFKSLSLSPRLLRFRSGPILIIAALFSIMVITYGMCSHCSATEGWHTFKEEHDKGRRKAESGDVDYQYITGLRACYYQGWRGPNYSNAIKYLRMAANNGHPAAMAVLGQLLVFGEFVGASGPKNCEEGLKWLRISADTGNSFAMYRLGCCYRDGECGPRDYRKAAEWFLKAAEKGSEEAKKALKEGGVDF